MPYILTYNIHGKDHKFALSVSTYQNSDTAILLKDMETGRPFRPLTVNLGTLGTDLAHIDVNNLPGIEKCLTDQLPDIFHPTGLSISNGYVSYPLFRIDVDAIRKKEGDVIPEKPWKNTPARRKPIPVPEKDIPELIGQIIDTFEDFLTEKEVKIENPERDEKDEDATIIYGEDYDGLDDKLRAILSNWKLI